MWIRHFPAIFFKSFFLKKTVSAKFYPGISSAALCEVACDSRANLPHVKLPVNLMLSLSLLVGNLPDCTCKFTCALCIVYVIRLVLYEKVLCQYTAIQ